jgi:hypothetical protein
MIFGLNGRVLLKDNRNLSEDEFSLRFAIWSSLFIPKIVEKLAMPRASATTKFFY